MQRTQTTQSEEEARALLEKHRKYLISVGKEVAIQLARERGQIQAQDVLKYMRENQMIPEDYTGRHNWVACVFKGKDSRKIWRHAGMKKIGCRDRNVHACPRAVWELR